MFSNKQSGLDKDIEQITNFICPICLQQYNQKNRYPMILCSKQHVACKKCTSTVIFKAKMQAKCPQCRGPILKSKLIQFRYLALMKKASDKYRQSQGIKQQQEEEHEQQEEHEVWSQIKQWTCDNNHQLKATKKLPAIYLANMYICNLCKRTKNAGLKQVWNCSICNYDLCCDCKASILGKSKKTCQDGHSLYILTGLYPPYYENSYKCNQCRQDYTATQGQPVMHCHECKYDVCPNCAD